MKGLLGHITIEPEMLVLIDWDGEPLREYEIDSRRAVVQGQGIIRSRPRFEQWACEFEIIYDTALVTNAQALLPIVADAGARIGVGDFRPEKNGWFGRFALWPK